MADLKNRQLQERYQTLLTTSVTTADPKTGTLQNGDGSDILELTIDAGTNANNALKIDKSNASAGNLLSLQGAAGNINFAHTGQAITFSAAGTITATGSNDLNLVSGQRVAVDATHSDGLYVDANITCTSDISGGSITGSGDLVLSASSALIRSNTSDASDNKQIIISGGGASGDTRGASVHISGNESGNAGLLQLRAGSGSVSEIRSYTGGSERTRINSSGNFGIGTTSPSTNLEIDGGTSTTVFINSSTHNSGTANEAKLQFGYGHSGSPDAIGYIKLNENSTNSFDGTMTFGVPFNNGSGSATRDALVIKNDGSVLVGTTDDAPGVADTNVGVSINSGRVFASAEGDYALNLNRNTSNGDIARFRKDGSTVGSISITSSATAYNTSSDYRLKENVVEMNGALDRVDQLKPSRFNFIIDGDTTVDGFLAHEVADVVPEAITGEKDAVDEEGNPMYQGIDQSKLVPLLVGAIQELRAEIEELKNK